MTTPSGTISLSDVNTELGYSSTALISMNDAAVRTLAGVPSGAISMQNLQNKSNRVTASATISSNTSNYTLNTAKAPGYSSGKTDMTLTINPSVYVYSTSTGSYALTVDTSWAAGDTVTVVNNGVIVGKGGSGGNGQAGYNGTPGSSGGPALLVQRATTMNNLNRIAGGGGGGGGGGFRYSAAGKSTFYMAGGGGGGGIGEGSGGSSIPGGYSGSPGSSGTLANAGGGGAGGSVPGAEYLGSGGPGGSGGGYGSSGSAGSPANAPGGGGGAAGACISGNSNITYTNTGTRDGSIS